MASRIDDSALDGLVELVEKLQFSKAARLRTVLPFVLLCTSVVSASFIFRTPKPSLSFRFPPHYFLRSLYAMTFLK